MRALVQYGDSYLLGNDFYRTNNPILKLDSILQMQPEHINKFHFLREQMLHNSMERMMAVDSLFGISPVDYGLINELERMSFYLKDIVSQVVSSRQDLTGDSEYPSHSIYQVWNSKKILNSVTIENDSSYLFHLIHEESPYVHPICKTTIKKYGGAVTSKQGWRDGKRHNGVDINCDQWDSIQSAFSGRVRFAKEYEGYGKVVIVRHYNGLETLYAHLASIKVKTGQFIKAGDLIGLAGSTGNSEGSHLHFEIRFKDQILNPENVIDFKTFTLRSDSLLVRKVGSGFTALPFGELHHVIERGDYPMKIAVRYGMDILTFTELNNITSKTKLKVGEIVLIK